LKGIRKKTTRIYEENFLRAYRDVSVRQMLEAEGRKALATAARIRDEGKNQFLQLRAAEHIMNYALGVRHHVMGPDDGPIECKLYIGVDDSQYPEGEGD
jgi:hypothetical protein